MHLEPNFEAFLGKMVPGCEAQWVGASKDEIEELEDFADQALPPFYQWFLATMGHDMGSLVNPRRDLSIGNLLSLYRNGFEAPRDDLLLIATEPDDIMPMNVYYDLGRLVRNDALVCSLPVDGGSLQVEFETLRGMLGWSVFTRFRTARHPIRCKGTFSDDARDIVATLMRLLVPLGFDKLLSTGPYCALFDQTDISLECTVTPSGGHKPYIFFEVGAPQEATIRSFLGTVATETSIEIQIDEWR